MKIDLSVLFVSQTCHFLTSFINIENGDAAIAVDVHLRYLCPVSSLIRKTMSFVFRCRTPARLQCPKCIALNIPKPLSVFCSQECFQVMPLAFLETKNCRELGRTIRRSIKQAGIGCTSGIEAVEERKRVLDLNGREI